MSHDFLQRTYFHRLMFRKTKQDVVSGEIPLYHMTLVFYKINWETKDEINETIWNRPFELRTVVVYKLSERQAKLQHIAGEYFIMSKID